MAQDEVTLRTAIETGAGAIALASLAVLGLALIAEIVRRRHANAAIVVLFDRLLPSGGRRCAVAILAVLSGYTAVLGAGPASADPSVRGWLTDPPAMTTNAPPTSVAPPAIAEPESPPPTTNSPAISVPMAPRVATVVESPARVPEPGPASVEPLIERRPATGPMDSPPPAANPWPQSTPTPPLAPPPTPPVPAPTVAPLSTYVVQPGDCLWTIAAHGLRAGATNIEIDHAWRALYAANQAGIGDNPSLIHPGLALIVAQVPATSTPPDL